MDGLTRFKDDHTKQWEWARGMDGLTRFKDDHTEQGEWTRGMDGLTRFKDNHTEPGEWTATAHFRGHPVIQGSVSRQTGREVLMPLNPDAPVDAVR
jgi:hypothetical protein